MNFTELAPVHAPQRQSAEIAARLLVSLPVFARSPATKLSLAWAKAEQLPWRTVMSVPLVDAMEAMETIDSVDAINTPETAPALYVSSPAALSNALMRVIFCAVGTSEPCASQPEVDIESDAARCARFLRGVEVLECFSESPTEDFVVVAARDAGADRCA